MATTSQTKKIQTGKRPFSKSPSSESTRKLTMKHIELDPENQFHNLSETGDEYTVGELYQVTHYNKKERAFELKGVKKVVADVELTSEQNDILKDILHIRGETIEGYLQDAVLDQLQADIDTEYKVGDPRRHAAFIATQHHMKRVPKW